MTQLSFPPSTDAMVLPAKTGGEMGRSHRTATQADGMRAPSHRGFFASVRCAGPKGWTGRFGAGIAVWRMLMTRGGPTLADEFPKLINSEADKQARPMRPAEAAEALDAPEGFHVDVFASEPQVQNPIAMNWDSRGRLWIAENFTYDGYQNGLNLDFRDRVLVFQDTDGDGKADERTVFLDSVQMLTSVEPDSDGVWLMCPPQLLFVPDRDRNLVPDGPAQIVLDGFTISAENYHNFANGLKKGPDGWLYGRCGGSCPGRIGRPGQPMPERLALEGGIWRYHPRRKTVEVLTHGTTNPWGHDWDAMGEMFYINTVNGHLWHLIPGAHYKRPFELDPNTKTYELIDTHADHWHFDTGRGWNRSRDGIANAFGGGHAHTGMMIYLGDNWPTSYRGNLFTFNFHGRRFNQEILQRHGSGYVAKHGKDILHAGDPFFRSNDLAYDRNGTVFLIDWSDTGECHEHTGVHRTSGRIFTVTYDDPDASSQPDSEAIAGHRVLDGQEAIPDDLYAASPAQLVDLHAVENEWLVRHARRVLAHRAATHGLETARKRLVQNVYGSDARLACRSLLTLFSMGPLPRQFLIEQLEHPNAHLRGWAIRMLTDDWPLDDTMGVTFPANQRRARTADEAKGLIQPFCHLAESDPSAFVRLVLASTLQRLPVAMRPQLARSLMRRADDATDHNLPLLVWYGLIPVAVSDPSDLADTAIASQWPTTQRLAARRLAEMIQQNPRPLEKILCYVASPGSDAVGTDANTFSPRYNLLLGIEEGLKGWRKAPRPDHWDIVVAVITELPAGDPGKQDLLRIVRSLGVLFGDGRAMDEVRTLVLDKNADADLRRSALESMVAARLEGLREVCLATLDEPRLNVVAARGLATFDDPQIARELIKKYRRFRAPQRPKVIALLTSRKSFSEVLVQAIESNKIPADALTAFDVRQIQSFGDSQLMDRVIEQWGAVSETSEEKSRRIAQLKKQLTPDRLNEADKYHGRTLFQKTCSKCHRLYGQGEKIGPDLTGSNRNNLDYLLQNIVSPSAVVGRDYRMSTVTTHRGQTFNGLIVEDSPRILTIQTQTDLQSIATQDIEEIRKTTLSPMPDGLLNGLSQADIRDLFAYLMHPHPLPQQSESPLVP